MKPREALKLWTDNLRPGITDSTRHNYAVVSKSWMRFLHAKVLADRDISEVVTKEYATSYVIWLGFRNKHRSTAKAYVGCLKLMCKWLVKNSHIKSHGFDDLDFDEIHGLRVSEKRVPFTEDEYIKVLAQSKKVAPHFYLPVRIAWETAMRSSDIRRLHAGSFNFEEHYLTFIPEKTKRLKPDPIQVPLTEGLSLRIKEHIENLHSHEELFPLSGRYYQEFSHMARSIGIKKTFHCFRSSCISRLMSAGVALEMIAKITGLNYSTIMIHYANPDLKSKQEALSKINRSIRNLP